MLDEKNKSYIDYEPFGDIFSYFYLCRSFSFNFFLSRETPTDFICAGVANWNGTMIARSRNLKRKQCVFLIMCTHWLMFFYAHLPLGPQKQFAKHNFGLYLPFFRILTPKRRFMIIVINLGVVALIENIWVPEGKSR